MSPVAAIWLLWVLWFFVWLIAAIMAKREPGSLHGRLNLLFHLIAVAAVLFLLPILKLWPGTDIEYGLWNRGVPDILGWLLVTVALSGFGLAAWASLHHLSRRKHGAGLVDSGPYAVVRHPVYLGLTAAAVMTAIIFGQPTSFLGALLLTAALVGKVFMEERQAADAAHLAYRQRVPMFVPVRRKRD